MCRGKCDVSTHAIAYIVDDNVTNPNRMLLKYEI